MKRSAVRSGRVATRTAVVAAALAAGLALSACGAHANSSASSTVPAAKGSVGALYAGSLSAVMGNVIGPAFQMATGYQFSGTSAGSTALAMGIRSKLYRADVFISAAPAVNATLEGAANGNHVSWYATFARSPLVLGYDPKSSFAAQLTSKPWYEVVTEPGFLLGRTDPASDPKGVLAKKAITTAARAHNLPALLGIIANANTIFPEQTLVGRLQTGQLDAGFFYASEAHAAGISTVTLSETPTLYAEYTVTVLNRAPNLRGGVALVNYLLAGPGRKDLAAAGLELLAPAPLTGHDVPPSVAAAARSR
jgi:molybdate/tungstate transport system substrate-binding protein